MHEFKNLTPAEVMERIKNIPTIAIVGASGAGKTIASNNLLNPEVSQYTSLGIGERSQTTNIPSNFILDSRVVHNHEFALNITKKVLDKKLIMGKLFEAVADEFIDNDYNIEDTIKSINDGSWEKGFLEPKDASYHLEAVKEDLDIARLIELTKSFVEKIDIDNFSAAVEEKKKALGQKAPKAKLLKKPVFVEYCLEMEENEEIENWIDNISNVIDDKLKNILGKEHYFNYTFSFSTNDKGRIVLEELYNPDKPYSLVVETIYISCRPRNEVIDVMKQKNPCIPFRMGLVDTIGMTQEGVDEQSLSLGIDRAFAKSVNGIILLINLEEREDTIRSICEGINEKINKLKNNSDIYILFSKGDKLAESKIDKKKYNLKTSQDDYDREIEGILNEISDSVEAYSKMIDSNIAGMRWQSLSYKHQDIDSRIIAIRKNNKFSDEEKVEYEKHFSPDGLFEFIINALYEQQLRLLPKNVKPILLTVNNIKENPLKVCIFQDKLSDKLGEVSQYLSNNRAVVGQYKGIPDDSVYYHSTVTAYYYKLKNGEGHTSRATVYSNISINMKMLIWSALSKHNLRLIDILNSGAIEILFDNLEDKELSNILKGINMDSILMEKSNSNVQREIVKQYYLDLIKNNVDWIGYQVLNRVSMSLSYDNKYIKSKIDEIYFMPGISYSDTFKRMQSKFRDIFGSEEFKLIICDEIAEVISEIVNRGFVII